MFVSSVVLLYLRKAIVDVARSVVWILILTALSCIDVSGWAGASILQHHQVLILLRLWIDQKLGLARECRLAFARFQDFLLENALWEYAHPDCARQRPFEHLDGNSAAGLWLWSALEEASSLGLLRCVRHGQVRLGLVGAERQLVLQDWGGGRTVGPWILRFWRTWLFYVID